MSSSQKLLLDYLETLGPEVLGGLFQQSPVNCLFLYRLVPQLGQYVIQRLLLIDGSIPFQEVRSWHPLDQRSAQNKALWKLKQLHIIQGKQNEVWLHPIFRENLLKAITDPEALPSGDEVQSTVDEHFQKHWNGILYCVATGGQTHKRYASTIDGAVLANLNNSGLLTKERSKLTITNQGFQFLLADTSEQAMTLLIQLMIDSPAGVLVEFLNVVFLLSLLPTGQQFDARILSSVQQQQLRTLSSYGLVLLVNAGRSLTGFIPSKLARAVSYTGHMPLFLTKEEGFLILETNYKFYAYTDSPLHLSIIALFMRIKTQFPNMIFGQLTQDSVQEAFRKGITAGQVIKFLTSSAHAVMRARIPLLPPTITDQINLWEQDRNRLRTKPGYLYQQFLSATDYDKTVAEANRIGAVLYANPVKRLLVVSETGHTNIRTFVKSNLK